MSQIFDFNNIFLDEDNNYGSVSKEELDEAVAYFDDVIENSVSPEERERVRAQKRQEKIESDKFRRRLISLVVAGLLLASVSIGAVHAVIDKLEEKVAVYELVHEFDVNVIHPNTHRTDDKQAYFYDYHDIAEAISEEGKDFSQQLYLVYNNLGENQANRVLEHVSGCEYETIGEYATANGFESIDDWSKSERKKMHLQYEISNNNDELAEMHVDINIQAEDSSSFGYGGK